MNIEQTKAAIAVMQAFVDGEQIQFDHLGIWCDVVGFPYWEWNRHTYRIKPDVVSYRRFFYSKANGEYTVETVTQAQHKNSNREGWAGFICWIDNKWIEEIV